MATKRTRSAKGDFTVSRPLCSVARPFCKHWSRGANDTAFSIGSAADGESKAKKQKTASADASVMNGFSHSAPTASAKQSAKKAEQTKGAKESKDAEPDYKYLNGFGAELTSEA